MAKAKSIIIKETEQELKNLLRRQPIHLKSRIQMLLVIKKSDTALNKIALASLLKVNHNTAQKWRKAYSDNGIEGLLSYGRIGFKPSIITMEMHQAIEERLHSPKDAFISYIELIDWLVDKYIPSGINYHTVNKYVKRHFGAKLKVARKSHINKDEKAVEDFKKTSN